MTALLAWTVSWLLGLIVRRTQLAMSHICGLRDGDWVSKDFAVRHITTTCQKLARQLRSKVYYVTVPFSKVLLKVIKMWLWQEDLNVRQLRYERRQNHQSEICVTQFRRAFCAEFHVVKQGAGESSSLESSVVDRSHSQYVVRLYFVACKRSHVLRHI